MSPRTRTPRQQGFTLIELMVALTVGMILSIAMFLVLGSAEGQKRTITSGNDADQAGNYASYLLDQWIRSAGNGFAKSAPYSFGCSLNVYQGTTAILPLPSGTTLPAPFASVAETGTAGQFRLAPVVILPGQTTPNVSGQKSDVLVIMAGQQTTGGIPQAFNGIPSATSVPLTNTVAFNPYDLVLLTQRQPSASALNTADCIIEQVASGFSNTSLPPPTALPLGGTFHNDSNNLVNWSDQGYAMVIGNVPPSGTTPTSGAPFFQLVGVGDNNTLYSYDLLNIAGAGSGTSAVARADGVFEMHALYGIDVNCDGKISDAEWAAPDDTNFPNSAMNKTANLLSGTTGDPNNAPTDATSRSSACATLTTGNDYLQKILAIRVGLIMRTSLPEKTAVTPGPLKLFDSLKTSGTNAYDPTYTRTLLSDSQDPTRLEQHYRYRTIEFTIPLRNTLMLP